MNSQMKNHAGRWLAAVCLVLPVVTAIAQQTGTGNDPLRFFFEGKRGQVEVGGPYVGVEFHQSRPVPSRFSFYYPVANSIDLSTDYWKRGESLPMAIGLAVNGGTSEWIQHESWSYFLSPHTVTFLKITDSLAWKVTYEFCSNQPAAVVTIVLRNRTRAPLSIMLSTRLSMSLRTCQTYTWRDPSLLRYDSTNCAITGRFDYVDTDSAVVFVENVGEPPREWTTSIDSSARTEGNASRGIAAFIFEKTLGAGDSLNIVQAIGSCKAGEAAGTMAGLRDHWRDDVRSYDTFIRAKSEGEGDMHTGDRVIDRSAVWARALIAANAHYLDGRIVPMPCPAEYNFFFTHDLLLTNLGAVQFDLQRVKSNLLYVASMAKDSVIPHAYYWRDDGYKTEYCEPENWNHLWFILVSGSYLRHSLDDSTGNLLYPCLTKSMHALLTRLHPDGLMYAYRPDWWDIGHVEGPRAYLTALTIRALREFLFISSLLHRQSRELRVLEETSGKMQKALTDKLWNPSDRYLTNYNEGEKDYHYYAGSLVAVVYDLLDQQHEKDLVATAARQLVDSRIGVRIAMPPDFNRDSVIRKFRFAGEEAGPPYSYANGGVWPHGNAWYAMALNAIGEQERAYEFAKRTMTIDGIAGSPNGLPAMYEYRSSDPQSPAFGTIDKPSFLWAGGMYLQVLYRILAVDENEWNLGIRHELPPSVDSVSCSLSFGGLNALVIKPGRDRKAHLRVDGQDLPSRILPTDLAGSHRWQMTRDDGIPVLVRANAIVHSVSYDHRARRLSCDVSSFDGHSTTLVVLGKEPPKSFSVNGRAQKLPATTKLDARTVSCTLRFDGSSGRQHLVVTY